MTRFGAALFALWFAAVRVEPQALHSCPEHGGSAATEVSSDAGAHAHHGMPSSEGSDESAGCSCVGECGAPCGATAIAAGTEIEIGFVSVATVIATPADAHESPRSSARLLPFANGPPARA